MFIGTSTFTKVVCNHALQQVRRHGNTIALTIETTFAVKMKALFFYLLVSFLFIKWRYLYRVSYKSTQTNTFDIFV